MKAKMRFLIIHVVVLLLTGLGISTSAVSQQISENSIIKDIPSMHIDGGDMRVLDLSEDLALWDSQVWRLAKALSVEGAGTAKVYREGVTIELLKPSGTPAHSKAIVIRKIQSKSTTELLEKKMAESAGIRFQLDELFSEGFIIELHHAVLIEIYNTTKSRVNLYDWQIRITYGAMPDATDAAIGTVIDKMSNVDKGAWKYPDSRNPQRRSLTAKVSMYRHIDGKHLNDPAKTLDEQLSAISDGTRQAGWNISVPSAQDWLEIYQVKTENDATWDYLIKTRDEGLDWLEIPEAITPSSPTDDR